MTVQRARHIKLFVNPEGTKKSWEGIRKTGRIYRDEMWDAWWNQKLGFVGVEICIPNNKGFF
jgi:hypothetical protein